MTVRELMKALSTAAPDAIVLFLAFGADLDEVVETSAVCMDQRPWTHEEGIYGGGRYDATEVARSSVRPATPTSTPRRFGLCC
jgi:hypothetical protein